LNAFRGDASSKYLGFAWRDLHPSGAASIEWYDRWAETGDPTIKQRILDLQ
jgi:predicted RecB family nuclease